MSYNPESLIAELEQYQEAAEEYFEDNLKFTEDVHLYGEQVTVKHEFYGPDFIKLEIIDDILPLSIQVHEQTFRLDSFEGDTATYRQWS